MFHTENLFVFCPAPLRHVKAIWPRVSIQIKHPVKCTQQSLYTSCLFLLHYPRLHGSSQQAEVSRVVFMEEREVYTTWIYVHFLPVHITECSGEEGEDDCFVEAKQWRTGVICVVDTEMCFFARMALVSWNSLTQGSSAQWKSVTVLIESLW